MGTHFTVKGERMNDLDKEAVRGVLPMKIMDSNFKETIEIIYCGSISGGARYKNSMPESLELIRRTKDGKEYRANYDIRKKNE